jgi:hypothetical protein
VGRSSNPALDAIGAQRGHFRYESGDHGDLWLAGGASLLALGDAAARIAAATGMPFHRLLALERALWPPDACPLCAAGIALGPSAAQSR